MTKHHKPTHVFDMEYHDHHHNHKSHYDALGGGPVGNAYGRDGNPSAHVKSHYPPIPPVTDPVFSGNSAKRPPTHMDVALPGLEPQPWVKDMVKWFAENTVGIARVDLRRPTPPFPEQYQGDNLFFASYKHMSAAPGSGFGGFLPHAPWRSQNQKGGWSERQPPAPPMTSGGHGYGVPASVSPGVVQGGYYASHPDASARSGPPTGARVKITRRFFLWRDQRQKGKPMVDIGAGLNIDMDRQRVDPVLRMKLGGLLSIKAFPMGLLKLSKLVPLGNTGMGVKIHYEVPIEQAHHFYKPPARLMVRLDQMPGTGVRLTPTGIECDQTWMRFGKNITLRASAGLAFPRTVPFDPENDDFGLKVHRLSIKSLW